MASNKSFLWSLAHKDQSDEDARIRVHSATNTFLWRTSSSTGPQDAGPTTNTPTVDAEAVYDDADCARTSACPDQRLYDDAGFDEQPHQQSESRPEKPARTTSSSRSSATSSGVWSSAEQWTPGDSGSTVSDEGPRYEEPTALEPSSRAEDGAAMLPAGGTSPAAARTTSAEDTKDAVDGEAGTRPTSVRLLAQRFEALSHHQEQFKRTPSTGPSWGAPGGVPAVTVDPDPATDGDPGQAAPRHPGRSSSSAAASTGPQPPVWRRPSAPAKPAPPPLVIAGARDSFSSSSESSPYNSPPPSPAGETPPPPPPLSTLPSRTNSRVSEDAKPPPPPPSVLDTGENIYETLRGSIEMETYANEPLYQIYNQNAEELAREHITREFESCSPGKAPPAAATSRDGGGMPRGQFRTLWCQLPEVQSSHILETLSPETRKLMEAKFEIITSEASYTSSLNILKNHFMVHLEQCNETDFSKEDRRLVFGDVVIVHKVAEKMLSQLEACRKKDIFLKGMFQVVHDIVRDDFKIFVDYCAYQNSRTRTLDRLITWRMVEPTSLGEVALKEVSNRLISFWTTANRYQQPSNFAQTLAALEAHPVCQGLTLQSFLLVPMQRITKLQLLVGAVLSCMGVADEEYVTCKMALQQISDVVHECNEGVRSVERMEELLALSKQLKFERGIKMLPLYSSNRWIIKKGKVTELNPEWFNAKSIYIFIFNDILFLAKKRKLFPQNMERFMVVDYCNREDVRLMNTEGTLHLPEKLSTGFCMLLTLLKNHRQKKVSKLLYFACESERQRWTDALNSSEPSKESKEWPQVVVKWPYTAEQPDELSLQVSDIIIVFTKSADGWYQGQRIRDKETGWFPGNYTVDVEPTQLREHSTDNNVVMSVYYV